ncbi:Inner membrane transport protein YajR [hydrothermal vent metagenome]|uniref:Inner membrane transport protein YajR n=1 Tax=hydrothermal vent metagenome TaxID=652676 RepID=A0A3B0XBH1_9ZZZZ
MSQPISNNLASQERRAAISLAMIYAFRMLGLFMILPIFALYSDELPGATPLLMGVALGVYGLTQAVLQIPFAMWSDKIGRKPVLYFGLLLFAAGSIVAGSAQSIEGIILGRAIQGAGAIAATLMALAADLSREEHRLKMMALIGASIGASFALSMVLGPIVNALVGISGIFYGTAVLALLGILILYFIVPEPLHSHFHRDTQLKTSSLADVFKDAQLLRLDAGIFILHFVLMSLFLVMPLLLRDFVELPAEKHWQIYLPVFAVSLLVMLPFIIIAERKQAMKPVFVGAILVIIMATLGFLNSSSSVLFICSLVLFFAGFNLLEASLPSLISKTADATQKGTAMGVYSSSQFFGAFAGGTIGGYAHQTWGIQGVFYVALLALSCWLLLAATMKKPSFLSTYLLNVNDVNIEQLLAVEGVVEATLIDDENESGQVAYLKVKKRILDEEKLLSLAVKN